MGRAKITEEEYIAIKAKWEAEKDKKTANRLHILMLRYNEIFRSLADVVDRLCEICNRSDDRDRFEYHLQRVDLFLLFRLRLVLHGRKGALG